MTDSLSARILRRIFGARYDANANEDAEIAVAHLIEQRDALAHALTHWDDAAREAGLTYYAVRDIARDVETGNISFGRGVELMRSLARVAAEQMAKDAIPLRELVDGAMPIIAGWGLSPAQRQWANEWTTKAHSILSMANDTPQRMARPSAGATSAGGDGSGNDSTKGA